MPHDSDDLFEADNATRPGRGPVDHPTMLGSCARAASADEARYRVDYPNSLRRTSRIFALDQAAAEAMYAVTEDPWDNAHFLTVLPGLAEDGSLQISNPEGSAVDLLSELDGADVVVLLATNGTGEAAAKTIAQECQVRNILCAGLALGRGNPRDGLDAVVNSMRKSTRVLVVAQDDDYIPAMLSALRA
ncbi:MAG: hypothetical protein WBA67_08485 [Jannaschia sp.]